MGITHCIIFTSPGGGADRINNAALCFAQHPYAANVFLCMRAAVCPTVGCAFDGASVTRALELSSRPLLIKFVRASSMPADDEIHGGLRFSIFPGVSHASNQSACEVSVGFVIRG
jgi:hypothetical protein